MAGHSKWANIQHRKGKQDKKRSKIMSRCAREILVAAKKGGDDPQNNPWLRLAIDKAQAVNMSKDKIANAIAKATGVGTDSNHLEQIRYEGYGFQGVALMIDCITNNRNRTVGDIRHVLSKYGGNLGTAGSVSYLFKQYGVIILTKGVNDNKILELALTVGADDVIDESDGRLVIIVDPRQFMMVRHALDNAQFHIEEAHITQIPSNYVRLDHQASVKMLNLFDILEDLDDVQAIYHNAELMDI